jgi:hypothetical protein
VPMHDWSRVQAGIFHHFHHSWIEEIARTLNRGLLPPDHYALAEQFVGGFGPDVLTLRDRAPAADSDSGDWAFPSDRSDAVGETAVLSVPDMEATAETDMQYYRRQQKAISVRHVSDDRVVAVIEVVSRANKASRAGFEAFVEKAAQLLEQRIHLLILDPHPPTLRDPQGIHGAIWQWISGEPYQAPAEKPLTLVAYEAALVTRAYVKPLAVGHVLQNMPVFLKPSAQVPVPLEATYQAAYDAMPRRWRAVLEREDGQT